MLNPEAKDSQGFCISLLPPEGLILYGSMSARLLLQDHRRKDQHFRMWMGLPAGSREWDRGVARLSGCPCAVDGELVPRVASLPEVPLLCLCGQCPELQTGLETQQG